MQPAFLPYSRQSIDEDDIQTAVEAMRSPLITRGPFTEKFEKAVADYCNVPYVVSFSNASVALAAACFAGEVSASDRFFTTPNSFIASTGVGVQLGANPIFIDIERQNGNFNLDILEHSLNPNATRGKDVIMAVHFAGQPLDMARLSRMIAREHTVTIEDAAHAFGGSYMDGSKVGCCEWSDMTVFSFHPAKSITTGEGGIVTTRNPHFYQRLLLYRNNGIVRPTLPPEEATWEYDVKALTTNCHLTEMQAALGFSQMKRLDTFIEKRRFLASQYRQAFADYPKVRLFDASLDAYSAHHLFVIQIDFDAMGLKRQDFMTQLKAKGIGSQVHYIPIYRHSVINALYGDLIEYFPEMETYYAQALSIPLFPGLEEKDVRYVAEAIKSLLG